MQAAAKAASRWLFPWERRHLEGGGGPLRWWEKAYWGLFVGGLAFLLASRLVRSNRSDEVDEEAEAAREAARRERARLALLGETFIRVGEEDEDEDVFEGMAPEEIQAYVAGATAGASLADPFEGMSPEEINEYLQRHGKAAAAG